MKVMFYLGESLRKLFSNPKSLFIGIVLFNIPIVKFIVPAYFFRCIRGEYLAHNSLPKWKNVNGLLKDWGVMIILWLIFMSGPITLYLFSLDDVMKLVKIKESQGILSFLVAMSGTVNLLFSTIFFIMMLYLVTMTYMVINDKRIKNFNFLIIIKKAGSYKYFLSFLILIIVWTMLFPVLDSIPFIGTGLANFALGVISVTFLARVYINMIA